jgi:hypothetical protein
MKINIFEIYVTYFIETATSTRRTNKRSSSVEPFMLSTLNVREVHQALSKNPVVSNEVGQRPEKV